MSETSNDIKRIRKERKLTQKKLGKLCGIAESNIRKYENGKQNPKAETLDKIAEALGAMIYYDHESRQHRLIKFEEGQVTRTIRTYADPEYTQKQVQELLKNESGNTDYDHSYSYASSEEDFNKNQIELANKKDGNTHKYDASIPIEVTPERIERNRIQNKLLAGEHVTPEELEVLNSYYSSEQFRNSYKKLKEAAQEGIATIERLKTAYSKLNDIGQEKVAEHAEMIAKIPEYRKNSERQSNNNLHQNHIHKPGKEVQL